MQDVFAVCNVSFSGLGAEPPMTGRALLVVQLFSPALAVLDAVQEVQVLFVPLFVNELVAEGTLASLRLEGQFWSCCLRFEYRSLAAGHFTGFFVDSQA